MEAFADITHPNPAVPALFPWYQDMASVYSHLVSVASKNSSFTFCGLITGPLFGPGMQSGMLGFDLTSNTATILDGGALRVSYTDLPQAALAVSRALERDMSGYLRISSVTGSQNEVLAALEKETRAKWERREETTRRYEEMSERMMRSADEEVQMQGAVLRILRIAFGGDCGTDWGWGDNEKLGLEEETLEAMVRKVVEKQYVG